MSIVAEKGSANVLTKLAFIFLAVFVAAGCARYNPSGYYADFFRGESNCTIKDGISVFVDFIDCASSEKTLGRPLCDKDIIPVFIEIQNDSDQFYTFKKSGVQHEYIQAEYAAKKCAFNPAIYGGIFPPALARTKSINNRIKAAFAKKEIMDIRIAPGESASGMLFLKGDAPPDSLSINLLRNEKAEVSFLVKNLLKAKPYPNDKNVFLGSYTKTNIFHTTRGRTFIPVGSKVKILDRPKTPMEIGRIKFLDTTTGKQTTIRGRFDALFTADHDILDQYKQKFTQHEMYWIQAGEIKPWMSKEAVLVAYGYPDIKETVSFSSNEWVYPGKNYRLKDYVYFKNNRVNSVVTRSGLRVVETVGIDTAGGGADIPGIKAGTGTGWPASSGYVVTSEHVVAGCNKITVIKPDGVKIPAQIAAKDKKNDIALLKVSDINLLPAALPISSSPATLGEKIVTLGYPLTTAMGVKPKLTDGIVSATTGIEDDPRVLQISVPIQPGNSGGPLVNMRGEVVGVVASTLNPLYVFTTDKDLPQNVNYGMKISYLNGLLSAVSPCGQLSTIPVKNYGSIEAIAKEIQGSVLMVVAE